MPHDGDPFGRQLALPVVVGIATTAQAVALASGPDNQRLGRRSWGTGLCVRDGWRGRVGHPRTVSLVAAGASSRVGAYCSSREVPPGAVVS